MPRGSAGKRFRVAIVGASAFAVMVSSVTAAAPAQATPAKAGDCSTAYLGPSQNDGATKNYFDLKVTPGARTVQHLLAANPTGSVCKVDLQRAYGKTAINSGDTYVAVGTSCSGAACWLSGLPSTITLRPNSRVEVPFTVDVPSDAEPGQFLAGVIGAPNVAPGASGRTGGVRVQVRTRVAIGVAVTVAGTLRPALRIPTVTIDKSQAPYASTVAIVERNAGNTWEHPKGSMTLTVNGATKRFPVVSNTVLGDGGVATLRVGAGRVTGAHRAHVELWYADHSKKAVWDGMLTFPALAPARKQGNQITVTPATRSTAMPMWVWGVIGAAVLLLILVVALLVALLRRRRTDGRDDGPDGSTDDSTPRLPTEPAPAV